MERCREPIRGCPVTVDENEAGGIGAADETSKGVAGGVAAENRIARPGKRG